jgi:hypothetical protein
MDVVTAGFVATHVLVLAILVWTAGRVGLSERFLLFFALFYSLAPLFPFTRLQYFQYPVDYAYDPLILLIYALTALSLVLVALVVQACPPPSIPAQRPEISTALKLLWWTVFAAWLIDIVFNWRFFLLPKHEYILSIPQQTKNLFVFTVPSKELLVGALAFSPFAGRRMRHFAFAIGILALAQSLALAVRHVALLGVLLLLLPRLRSLGFLALCLAVTFVGELSNAVKLVLSPASGMQEHLFDFAWWREYFVATFGVSGEQKAILSNLLIKLGYPELLEIGRGLGDMFAGLSGAIAVRLGMEMPSSPAGLWAFVGALEGQGTAYSLHIAILESFGVVLVLVLLVAVLARVTMGTMLFVLAGELMYSMMRNGVEYWASQITKLVFLILLVWFGAQLIAFMRRHVFLPGPAPGTSGPFRTASAVRYG